MSEQINTVVYPNSVIVRFDGNTEQRHLNVSATMAGDGTGTYRSLSTDKASIKLGGRSGEATGISASVAMDLEPPSRTASSLPDNVDLQGRIDLTKQTIDTLLAEVSFISSTLVLEKSEDARAKAEARMHRLQQAIQNLNAIRDSSMSCMAATNNRHSFSPAKSLDMSSVVEIKPGRGLYRPVIVPRNLPAFQWVGMKEFDHKSTVFPTVDACLIRFEDVMFLYGLDFDKEYGRLVPVMLSSEQRAWYSTFVSSSPSPASWNDFKYAIKARYEASALRERQRCGCELMGIEIMPDENVVAFIDRFMGLRRRSLEQAPSDYLMVQAFLNALPRDLRNRVETIHHFRDIASEPSIDVIADIAREVLETMSAVELAIESAPVAFAHTAAAGRVTKRYTKATKKSCIFHKGRRHNHDTSECRRLLEVIEQYI
ncbi:unnamed protein product [Mucor fragilis]